MKARNELIYYAEFGFSYLFGELCRTEDDYVSVTSEDFFRNFNKILTELELNCSYVTAANLNNFRLYLVEYQKIEADFHKRYETKLKQLNHCWLNNYQGILPDGFVHDESVLGEIKKLNGTIFS